MSILIVEKLLILLDPLHMKIVHLQQITKEKKITYCLRVNNWTCFMTNHLCIHQYCCHGCFFVCLLFFFFLSGISQLALSNKTVPTIAEKCQWDCCQPVQHLQYGHPSHTTRYGWHWQRTNGRRLEVISIVFTALVLLGKYDYTFDLSKRLLKQSFIR